VVDGSLLTTDRGYFFYPEDGGDTFLQNIPEVGILKSNIRGNIKSHVRLIFIFLHSNVRREETPSFRERCNPHGMRQVRGGSQSDAGVTNRSGRHRPLLQIAQHFQVLISPAVLYMMSGYPPEVSCPVELSIAELRGT
jgi:hypothetical protein